MSAANPKCANLSRKRIALGDNYAVELNPAPAQNQLELVWSFARLSYSVRSWAALPAVPIK